MVSDSKCPLCGGGAGLVTSPIVVRRGERELSVEFVFHECGHGCKNRDGSPFSWEDADHGVINMNRTRRTWLRKFGTAYPGTRQDGEASSSGEKLLDSRHQQAARAIIAVAFQSSSTGQVAATGSYEEEGDVFWVYEKDDSSTGPREERISA